MQPVRKRTAVLVVHGMGLQRPLETVRGIVRAVWLSDETGGGNKKIWMHPERSGIDIDLPVIATSSIPKVEPPRSVDFHELYWSHLMSETPALAVLLWLFELIQKGPRLKPNMQLLWGVGAVFLVSTIFSASFLALKLVERLSGLGIRHELLIRGPFLALLIFCVAVIVAFAWHRAWRFIAWFCIPAIGSAIILLCTTNSFVNFTAIFNNHGVASMSKNLSVDVPGHLLPIIVASVATGLLMGWWGWGTLVFVSTWALSIVFEVLYRIFFHNVGGTDSASNISSSSDTWPKILLDIALPGSMNLPAHVTVACAILGSYILISALFLQPYLGDAARYFRQAPSNVAVRREIRRQAVDTLEDLHLSGRYDRIVVVAHSLGSVIAYDMLRAYFARVARKLPTCGGGLERKIGEFEKIMDEAKSAPADTQALRKLGREIVREIAGIVDQERRAGISRSARNKNVGLAGESSTDAKHDAWLVTDFVTLGSPLTHAHYLMCQGCTADELAEDFRRGTIERELPTCPPTSTERDGALTFAPATRRDEIERPRWFHNGALFGLTRWTNLYFPVTELFRGDPIGGPLNEIFGCGIFDIELSGRSPVSAHIKYWDVLDENPGQPHIFALRTAIDLADEGLANVKSNFLPSEGSQQYLKAQEESERSAQSTAPECGSQIRTA
jgi:hypothetical protein